jgi:hypothetical protein
VTRRQRPPPDSARVLLETIPVGFVDDGCSNSPDSFLGFYFQPYCRIHDWRYCTRCWPAGSMTASARKWADMELGLNLRAALPWRWRWVGWIYRLGVWRYGGVSAFDSCGPTVGPVCRHNMPPPDWMGAGEEIST